LSVPSRKEGNISDYDPSLRQRRCAVDVDEIEAMGAELRSFLQRFEDCFVRSEPREHLRQYVQGQLSDLPRKSLEPIALQAGIPPRTLQDCFARAHWDQRQMRDRLQQIVAQEHAQAQAVGIFDETSFAKKGQKSPGVQRQYCGSTGKIDNCVVTIHLSYATPEGFRVLLDGELFLPESWDRQAPRKQEAGIPEALHHRPRWQIALDLLETSRGNGVVLPWVTFDENYGMVKAFLLQLDERGQRFAGEVPRSTYGWSNPPAVAAVPENAAHGWRWLHDHSPGVSSVENLCGHSPLFTAQPWTLFYVKDSNQGPVVWRAKYARFYLCQEDGRPRGPWWLIVAQNVLEHEQIKYFLSNASPGTPAEAVLGACLGRYPIERCFEDDKTELGLGDFEVRLYPSLLRHLRATSLSSLFLARMREQQRGKKPADHGLPDPHGGQRLSGIATDAWPAAAGVLAAAV
jgi:SRSO17 transposase